MKFFHSNNRFTPLFQATHTSYRHPSKSKKSIFNVAWSQKSLTGHKPPRKLTSSPRKGAATNLGKKHQHLAAGGQSVACGLANVPRHWLQVGTSSRRATTSWTWTQMDICHEVAAFDGPASFDRGCEEPFLPAEGVVNPPRNTKRCSMLQRRWNPPVLFTRLPSTAISSEPSFIFPSLKTVCQHTLV